MIECIKCAFQINKYGSYHLINFSTPKYIDKSCIELLQNILKDFAISFSSCPYIFNLYFKTLVTFIWLMCFHRNWLFPLAYLILLRSHLMGDKEAACMYPEAWTSGLHVKQKAWNKEAKVAILTQTMIFHLI